MPRDWFQFLEDMIKAANKAVIYCAGRSAPDLLQDDMRLEAVTLQIQIIGEAAKRVPESIRELAPDIPWREICGLRDIIVHEYFDADNQIIIDVALNKLPILLERLQRLHRDFESM
ncbi:MAG: DUF86 domain-containing protein [Chlamydiia bacterium]